MACRTDGECEGTLTLPDRGWILQAAAPGWWVAGPPTWADDGRTASFELWPAVGVRGSVAFPERTSGSEVALRLRASEATARAATLRKAEVTCPIAEGAFSCDVPAGRWDVAARVRGHASVFLRDRTLPSGAGTDLGKLVFLPGASVIGSVVSSEKGAPKAGECRVTVHPSGDSGESGRQVSIAPLSAYVDERGFFAIERVPAGRYQIVATQPGFAPASQEVVVLEGAEASLKRPLELGRPRRVEVFLAPPLDASGRAWRVALVENVGGRGVDVRGDSPASARGEWSFDGASTTGRYRVRVRTAGGHDWFTDDDAFAARDSPTRRFVSVGIEEVRGRLLLGERPIQGTVTFGGEFGAVAVPLRSDPEGVLEGYLPRIGNWQVTVSADDPPVKRALDVDVRRSPAGHGDFEIRLPDAALHGEVVLEDGQPASRATVNARFLGRAESSQVRAVAGRFRFAGLPAGKYTVSAEGPGTYSEDVAAVVREDESSDPAEPIRLVLKRKDWLRLRLVGPSGGPVVGFPVWFLPGSDTSAEGAYSRATDANGRVSVSVRGGEAHKCVAAFGGGYATTLVAAVVGEEQVLPLGPAGGTLFVGENAPPAVLVRSGCRLPVAFLVRNGGSDGKSVPNLEPGGWALCPWGPNDRTGPTAPCRSGHLAPYGTLDLSGFAPKE